MNATMTNKVMLSSTPVCNGVNSTNEKAERQRHCIGIEALSLVMTMAVTNVVKQLALDQGNVNNEQK